MKGGGQAKFWLSDCRLARARGFADRELRLIRRKVEELREELLRAWHDHLELEDEALQIATVDYSDSDLTVTLKDGRRISVPLWWLPRLLDATPEQRADWQIIAFGDAIEWPAIDEHVSVKGLLRGKPAPGANPPPDDR